MGADLCERKGKISDYLKKSTSIVTIKSTSIVLVSQNEVGFQRRGSSIVLKSLLNLLGGWQCCPFMRKLRAVKSFSRPRGKTVN